MRRSLPRSCCVFCVFLLTSYLMQSACDAAQHTISPTWAARGSDSSRSGPGVTSFALVFHRFAMLSCTGQAMSVRSSQEIFFPRDRFKPTLAVIRTPDIPPHFPRTAPSRPSQGFSETHRRVSGGKGGQAASELDRPQFHFSAECWCH